MANHTSKSRGTGGQGAGSRHIVNGGKSKGREMNKTIKELTVGGSKMEVFVFDPELDTPLPAIILAQHIPVGHTGLENDEFTLKTAERYAEAGYVVAVPFIFHWWPKSEEMMVKAKAFTDDKTKLDLEATYDLLVHHPKVDREKIGIVGHCWGGRVAWLGACLLPVQACAVFYGGRVKLPLGEGNPPAIDLTNQMSCTFMGFFGDQDQNPSPEDVNDYEAALREAGINYTFYRYPDAGHAFQNFPTPERYNEAASEDAWVKVLEFLDKTLK